MKINKLLRRICIFRELLLVTKVQNSLQCVHCQKHLTTNNNRRSDVVHLPSSVLSEPSTQTVETFEMATGSVKWFDNFFNWQLSLSSVPLGNALLADLLLVSAVFDSPLHVPDEGFRYLKHPKSLHTNLLVIVDRGHKAFEIGQTNMKDIKTRSLHVMVDFKTILEILKSGQSVDTEKVIQVPLNNIERTAEQWNELSSAIVKSFHEPMCLVTELISACKDTLSQKSSAQDPSVETVEQEMDAMKEEYSKTLIELEKVKSKEMDVDEATVKLMEYSLKVLARLEQHWKQALSSLKSMVDVVQKVASAGLFEFADYVKENSRVLPLSASDVKFLLTATAKVHQICDATERMADLYGTVTDKYVMNSFDSLAQMVVVDPDKEEPNTLLVAGYRMWDQIVPTAGREDEMIKQIDQRLAQIENEYIFAGDEAQQPM